MKEWMSNWRKERRGERKEKEVEEVNTDRYWLYGDLPSPHDRVRS